MTATVCATPSKKRGSRCSPSNASEPCTPSSTASESHLSLEDVVRDAHMQSVFLQYLSAHDKKGFARLLFLVSVEEFKKLLTTGDTFEEDVASVNRRIVYASKIISKFMSKDAFLDIASENLRIHNKSVWSFGSFLRNDLMLHSSLSSKADLFDEAEMAVKNVLMPSFQQFMETKEYTDLARSAQIGYSVFGGDEIESHDGSLMLPSPCQTPVPPSPLPSPMLRTSSYLSLQRVLSNRRLCSVFWVYLFKERTHQQLSLWMDFRYNLLPLLRTFLAAVDEEESSDDVMSEGEHPAEMIDQILDSASKLCRKYIIAGASAEVSFASNRDRELLSDFLSLVSFCNERGSFCLEDAEMMVKAIEKLSDTIEYNLKVNHFVRFMASDSFKSLVSSYQNRLMSPSAPLRNIEASDETFSSSNSSDCSMTTLQELFHCMNVASHQPQRVRNKKFTLKSLYESQSRTQLVRGADSLISSVMTFRLDTQSKTKPFVVKDVLYTLAKDSDMRHHHAIPDHVEAFFCPGGPQVVRAKSRPEPKIFHMTIGTTERAFYAACLTRYVPLEDENQLKPLELVLRETEGLQVFVPVGVCIISRYPVLNTLRQRLEHLYTEMRDHDSFADNALWKPSPSQMDRLLAPFNFHKILNMHMLDSYVDFSMEELFDCLSIRNVVSLVTSLILERQIVLVSSKYSVLTSVGETLRSLIAPLKWSHVFAPILPKNMLECLQCPTPYLFGVHSSYGKELHDMLKREGSCDNILVVDLDQDRLSAPVEPCLPNPVHENLIVELQKCIKSRVFFADHVTSGEPVSISRRFPEARIRACFRDAIEQMLFRLEEFRYVLSDDFDFVVVFDRMGYMSRVDVEEKRFFKHFLETQVFSHQIASVA